MKRNEWFLILLLFIYFFSSYIYVEGVIPDYFNLSEHNEPNLVYEVILTTVTTVMGLWAIVFLIYFDNFQKITQKGSIEFISNNISYRYLTIISFLTILFSFFSLISVKNQMDYRQVSRLYFCILLFFINLLALIPFTIAFTNLANHHKYAIDLLEKLQSKSLNQLYQNAENNYELGISLEQTNINNLKELLEFYIKSKNILSAESIFNKQIPQFVGVKGYGHCENTTEKVIRSTKYLCDDILLNSIIQRDYISFRLVVNVIRRLFDHCAENGLNLSYFNHLIKWVSEIIRRCQEEDRIQELECVVEIICASVTKQFVNNCPDIEKIHDYYSFDNDDYVYNESGDDIQNNNWQYLESRMMNFIYQIHTYALERKVDSLIYYIHLNISYLVKNVISSSIHDDLKGNLIVSSLSMISNNVHRFINSGGNIGSRVETITLLNSRIFKHLLKDMPSYSSRVLEIYYVNLEILIKNKVIQQYFPDYLFLGYIEAIAKNYQLTRDMRYIQILEFHIDHMAKIFKFLKKSRYNQESNLHSVEKHIQKILRCFSPYELYVAEEKWAKLLKLKTKIERHLISLPKLDRLSFRNTL